MNKSKLREMLDLADDRPMYPVKSVDPKSFPAPLELLGHDKLAAMAASKVKRLVKSKKAPKAWYFYTQEMRRRQLYPKEVETILSFREKV